MDETTREGVLAILDNYAATGDHAGCSRRANSWGQAADRARNEITASHVWFQAISVAAELRAAAIHYRLEGQIGNAVDCERSSERYVLDAPEIER